MNVLGVSNIVTVNMKGNDSDTDRPKRKRQRLDHMTAEEKLMRRKLKNRVAAQSARDRKKVKMNDLEHQLMVLNKERNKISKDNNALRLKNEQLMRENIELKKRLGLIANNGSELSCDDAIASHWSGPVESAELINVPQQQEPDQSPVKGSQSHVTHSMMPFVYLYMIMSLMRLLSYCKSAPKNYWILPLMKMETNQMIHLKTNQWNQWNQWTNPLINNWSPSKT